MTAKKRAILRNKTAVLLICLAAGTGTAGDLIFSLDVSSRYIWRGMDLFANNKPALQPGLTWNFGETGLSLNLWSSVALAPWNRYKSAAETDITLDYTFSLSRGVMLSAGFIHYGWYFSDDFRMADHTSREVYAAVSLPEAMVSPAIRVYYDFGNGDGWYILAGFSRTLRLASRQTIDLALSLGCNGGQWLPEDAETGLSDLNVSVSLPVKNDFCSLRVFAAYTLVLLESVNSNNEVFAGLSISRGLR